MSRSEARLEGMASEDDKQETPVLKNIGENIAVAEGSDDFIIIELIGECNSKSSTSNITPDPQSPAVSIDSGYEDFVELSIEDVQQVCCLMII